MKVIKIKKKDILQKLISNKSFFAMSGKIFPWVFVLTLFTLILGLYWGYYWSPPDYQQGEGFRIIYVHVPAAFWSLSIYSLMFIFSVIFLIWRIKLADILASESAIIGAIYTFIALVTGMIWGKPMWGTWWVWDARLTSELILLFLFLGYIGLRFSIEDGLLKAKLSGILAVIGMVDVPIVHFSVQWWQTLHQGPTLARLAKPLMPIEMLIPLLILLLGFGLCYLSLLFLGVRSEILSREYESLWLQEFKNMQGGCSSEFQFSNGHRISRQEYIELGKL